LKLLYPVTPQETFEAIVAGFLDPNPCIVFEHKLLYGGKPDILDFNGDVPAIWRPRKYTEGTELTIVAFGAMVEAVCSVVKANNYSAEVWNPFILNPLKLDEIIGSVRRTGRLLVVQESGKGAGMGNRIISEVCREAFNALTCPPQLIGAPDAPVPFAKELELVHIPDVTTINQTIAMMIGVSRE
jgi:pyruvate dehydrogenase E1 component beta subunit